MNKEEILRKHLEANDNHSNKLPDQFTRMLIYNAMDEYAKALVKFNISAVGSALCSCGSLKAKPKTDMSKPYECAECDKPIYKN